jgi:hypothetical protein
VEGVEEKEMAAKVVEYGANRPIAISLPDCYWDVLFAMAELEGREVEDLATERLKQIIIEDAVLDTEHIGEIVAQGWQETLKDDKYYQETAAGR